MKANNIVAVFEILNGKIEFLGLSKNFEEDYKITTVTTNREIYYKKLDECEDYELNLIPDTIEGIWFYMYKRMLEQCWKYFLQKFYYYDYVICDAVKGDVNLIFSDDLPDLLLRVKEIDEVGLAIYFPENLSIIEDFTTYYERNGIKYLRVFIKNFDEFKVVVDEYFKKY
jgi:hypothetical protein